MSNSEQQEAEIHWPRNIKIEEFQQNNNMDFMDHFCDGPF